jgi:hypothetical protein
VLDARYEQLRHAALHARASAFPLGLGVLTGKGVTAWRRLLTCLTSTATPGTVPPGDTAARVLPPGTLPDLVTTELVHVLAAVAVALAGT